MSRHFDNHQLDILLDRLVDGELNGEEYRHLLARLDEFPEGWRRCALAFLEAQAWGRELSIASRAPEHASRAGSRPDSIPLPTSKLTRESQSLAWETSPIPPVETVPVETVPVETVPVETVPVETVPVETVPVETRGGERPAARRMFLRWSALAASWLIVFACGWSLHIGTGGASRQGTLAPPPIGQPSRVSTNDSLVEGRVMRPVVSDIRPNMQDAGYPNASLPLNEMMPMAAEPALPDELREYARTQGLDLSERAGYVPLHSEDGHQYVLPVRRYDVAPMRRVAY